MTRNSSFEIRRRPAWRGCPIETVESESVVEPAGPFLIADPALDERFRTDAAEWKTGGRVIIGVDENVLVRRERIGRRVQRDAQIQVIGIVGEVDRSVIGGTRRVRRVQHDRLDTGPVVE